MSKTNFGPGVIVTSKWLNGAREIHFDGQDLDFHYAPLTRRDLQRGGEAGIDNVYVTVATDQTADTLPITGNKSFFGLVEFGSSRGSTSPGSAPKSWATNYKYTAGGTTEQFTLKYSNLENEDMITKLVLQERFDNFPVIDEGKF